MKLTLHRMAWVGREHYNLHYLMEISTNCVDIFMENAGFAHMNQKHQKWKELNETFLKNQKLSKSDKNS